MRVFLVEDSQSLVDNIVFQLDTAGIHVDCCPNGEDALYIIRRQAYDVILLDRMLPGIDGLTLLSIMRKENIHTPVLMLTALSAVTDRVEGLDAGADDYLVKPFATDELLARIRSLSRRPPEWEKEKVVISFHDIALESAALNLRGPKGTAGLSKKEAELFEVFLRNPDRYLTREILFSYVWGYDGAVEDGNLDNYIYFLRKKLKAVASECSIVTKRSVGFKIIK